MEYRKLLDAAFADLEAAAKKLQASTVPGTPLPRFREFVFASRGKEKVSWPGSNGEKNPVPSYIRVPGDGWAPFSSGAEAIAAMASHQPRLILRALRRIQAATAWCEARAEGRRRAAEEILRQQQEAVETLETEVAMQALK